MEGSSVTVSSTMSILRQPSVVYALALTLVATVLYLFLSKSSPLRRLTLFTDSHKGHKREEDAASLSSQGKAIAVQDFRSFKVVSSLQVSHNVKLIRLELPQGLALDLPIGRHLSVRGEVDGQKVIRAYTPTTHPNQKGYFELLVKSYQHGKLSTYLHSKKIGDFVEARGPIGRFQYTANKFHHMAFLMGGSGVTPALQVLRTILEDTQGTYASDKTLFTLYYQNRTVGDILLKKELDEMQEKHSNRLRIAYFLSNPEDEKGWVNNASLEISKKQTYAAQEKGYINDKSLKHLQRSGKSNCDFVGICGPSSFNEAMKTIAQKAGHNDQTLYMW